MVVQNKPSSTGYGKRWHNHDRCAAVTLCREISEIRLNHAAGGATISDRCAAVTLCREISEIRLNHAAWGATISSYYKSAALGRFAIRVPG